ncbi:MAG: RiPP maturation radical SAM C-methyltransferase [Kofleriaceae bacterium]
MIVLVNMPFGSITWPCLGIGLIKAQLEQAGLPVRALNPNFLLARLMGFGQYETLVRFKGHETQVSEWLFADACWRRRFGPDEDEFLNLCGHELGMIPKVTDVTAYLRRVRDDIVPAFLEKVYEQIVRDGVPKVVGFSCMFFQTVASLALGRMLKERHPEIKVAYGGACFHGEMGEELFRGTPWIDVVATGEADAIMVQLFETMLRGETPRDLPGILARDANGEYRGPPPVSATGAQLDELPDPCFDSFFESAREVGLADSPAWLERVTCCYETSRGCWWGQKSHCTFCGLNGTGMGYREKRPEKVLATMRNLVAKYPVARLDATDNILSLKYFKTLIPELSANPILGNEKSIRPGQPIKLFFEVKANMGRQQMAALNAAGIVEVQPGIENLSTGILDAFDKGVTALQNVYFLKLCREYRIIPGWNILIRIPGETKQDYDNMEALIPTITHLPPPTGGAPRVECHRFSPYHSKKGTFTEDVRAASWYRGLFPSDQFDLDKVAYYFDVTWKNVIGDPHYDRLLELVQGWRQMWIDGRQPRLDVRETPEGIEIEDSRREQVVTWKLTARQSEIYRLIADPSHPREIAQHLAGVTEDEVRGELDELVRKQLVFCEKARFVALACSPPEVLAKKLDHTGQTHMSRIANQLHRSDVNPRIRLPVV